MRRGIPQVSASGPGSLTYLPTVYDVLQIVKGPLLRDGMVENQSGDGNLGLSGALQQPNPEIWGKSCHHFEPQCPHPWS